MIRWLISALGLVPVDEVAREGELENQLRMLTTSPEQRAELLEAAVIVSQCGLKPDDLAEVISRGMLSDMRLVIELGRWKHLDSRIERRIEEIWAGE